MTPKFCVETEVARLKNATLKIIDIDWVDGRGTYVESEELESESLPTTAVIPQMPVVWDWGVLEIIARALATGEDPITPATFDDLRGAVCAYLSEQDGEGSYEVVNCEVDWSKEPLTYEEWYGEKQP